MSLFQTFKGVFRKGGDREEMTISETAEGIIERVNCPHRVFAAGGDGNDVLNAYQEALERGREQGFTPLLVVADETLEEWLGILEEEQYSREKELAKVTGRGKEILTARYQEEKDGYGDEGELENREWLGELKDGEALEELSSFYDLGGKGIRETILFEIPTKNPWEVIAWLPIGGWNECPGAAEMMEICRYWYEEYHAVPAVLSHDELEFTVEGPVAEEEQAWGLARQHYAFSPDRVDQCTAGGTLGEVADCLRKSTVWYFWWD